MTMQKSAIPPPFSGRRGPEGVEVGSRYRLKKNVRYPFLRFVIPSAAEGSFSFPVSFFLRKAVCMKHRPPQSHGGQCFPFPSPLCLTANEKDFSRSLEMTNVGERYSRIVSLLQGKSVRRHSPSFPWKGLPSAARRGWLPQQVEKECEIRLSPFRHPERSRGIFFVSRFRFPS